ncbi:MAG: hypothetical protein MZV64_01650 [Ignavibacteriales bacterium]|nr:hypothetical protein [Ignavibacteriales bacterium]
MLSVMGLGTPIICSDIRENLFIVHDDALLFEKSNIDSSGIHLNMPCSTGKNTLQKRQWPNQEFCATIRGKQSRINISKSSTVQSPPG